MSKTGMMMKFKNEKSPPESRTGKSAKKIVIGMGKRRYSIVLNNKNYFPTSILNKFLVCGLVLTIGKDVKT